MTTTLLAPASPPPVLDLDARLACVDAYMTVRLDEAAVAFEIRTAHIQGANPAPDLTGLVDTVPLTPTLTPKASPYTTPLADLLHRARLRLETHGWTRGQLRDDQAEKRCPWGAIRVEAASRTQADDACDLLLEAIQRDFADAESVPSWNDAQTSPGPVLLMLGKAADLAHARGI